MSEKLPANLEAERALLGGMLLNGFFDAEILLAADDFFLDANRRIYLVMAQLADAGEPLDLVTVDNALRKTGQLDQVGGPGYLVGLTDAPMAVNLSAYERIIREAAVRRRVIRQAENLQKLAYTESLEHLAHQANGLSQLLADGTEEGPAESLEALSARYEHYVRHMSEFVVHSGIKPLDNRTDGFQLGEVVTLIARTGVGKSAIAQNMMTHLLTTHAEAGVAFFSLEMPGLQAFERHLQIFAGKAREDVIKAYREGQRNWVRAGEFVEHFNDRLVIIDKPMLTLPEITRRVRALVKLGRLKPVRLVVIDYLGYLDTVQKKLSIVERVSELARGAKQLAKELNAVVLLLAQTSRTAGDGSEEVTVLDARDSGAIEDSADFLLGAWRPEMKGKIKPEEYAELRGRLWIRILKARRGLLDKFLLRFDRQNTSCSASRRQDTSYAFAWYEC